jgi:protein involved in temperature-dependent protein secretion
MPRTRRWTTRAASSDAPIPLQGDWGRAAATLQCAPALSPNDATKENRMFKNLIIALALTAAAAASALAADSKPAAAATASPAKSAQQQKMTQCNKDATGKKGDERKAFMKACLSKKA